MKNTYSFFRISLKIIFLGGVLINAGFSQTPKEHMQWWHEARFGMLITWGLYSIPAHGEWIMYQEHIPFEEYARLADQVNPQSYRPSEWVALAKEAGMKYIVIVTRHHDGFCLFDSKVTSATLLANGQQARIEQNGDRVWLHHRRPTGKFE